MKYLVIVLALLLCFAGLAIADIEVGLKTTVVDRGNSDIESSNKLSVTGKAFRTYGYWAPYAKLDHQIGSLNAYNLNIKERSYSVGVAIQAGDNSIVDVSYKTQRYPTGENLNALITELVYIFY